MAKTMPAVDVAIIGAGWTGSIIGKELAAAGQRVVVLERGEPRWPSPDFQGPNVHDELKYTRRHALHQNTASETFTFRNHGGQIALPMRRWQFAYPGTHLGGAGNHWSGRTTASIRPTSTCAATTPSATAPASSTRT